MFIAVSPVSTPACLSRDLENKDDLIVVQDFTKGAFWGILSSVLFYLFQKAYWMF